MEDDRIAPGFRFYPTEEELVSFYLQKKLEGRRQDLDLVIPECCVAKTPNSGFSSFLDKRMKPAEEDQTGSQLQGIGKLLALLVTSSLLRTESSLRQEFSLCRVYIKSKCMRAFDRRPSAAATSDAVVVAQVHHGGGDHEATTSSNHHNSLGIERTTSTESSSGGGGGGGDHTNPSQTSTSDHNWDVGGVDNEALWDWEQLDWQF
ncbi:hypothetical protein HYC85_006922 [Camellia sinensis]|uniref:NAC domain-containing protein n=1 Tax=Camellia sinensis TaxID=4442 RepID=A0A7J7HPY7_CAMSI|nr:hypothetical protein HYC85_006922 [Camellia sinensis]